MTYEIVCIDTVQGVRVSPRYMVSGIRTFRCDNLADAEFLRAALNSLTRQQVMDALDAAAEPMGVAAE